MRLNLRLLMLWMGCVSVAADGPPAEQANRKVIAVVLGREITEGQQNFLGGLILQELMRDYVAKHQLAPSPEEVKSFLAVIEDSARQHRRQLRETVHALKAELDSATLSAEQRQAIAAQLQQAAAAWMQELKVQVEFAQRPAITRRARERTARKFISCWKFNRALYRKYGGRVVFQQGGPEPLDAYRQFLKQAEQDGLFKLLDERYTEQCWRYYTDDRMHRFFPPEEAAEAINIPFWEKPCPIQ